MLTPLEVLLKVLLLLFVLALLFVLVICESSKSRTPASTRLSISSSKNLSTACFPFTDTLGIDEGFTARLKVPLEVPPETLLLTCPPTEGLAPNSSRRAVVGGFGVGGEGVLLCEDGETIVRCGGVVAEGGECARRLRGEV